MALFSMTVVGAMPAGQLAGGAIAERLGARGTVLLGGLLGLVGMLRYWRVSGIIDQAAGRSEAG